MDIAFNRVESEAAKVTIQIIAGFLALHPKDTDVKGQLPVWIKGSGITAVQPNKDGGCWISGTTATCAVVENSTEILEAIAESYRKGPGR